MNKFAVFHQPESRFAYALNGDTLAVTLQVASDDDIDGVEILYNNKYDFTKKRFVAAMERYADDGTFCYYRAVLRLADARFAYIFRITEKGNPYYFSEDGLAEDYDFELAYYTFFQFAFINPIDVMQRVAWADSAVFYQIFVDRFARGDYKKDASYINTEWNGDIDRHSFCGGDIDGICEKLAYLQDLGINALYLTPVFLSETNHKYNIKDYSRVDPQFGSSEKLKRLLYSAHRRGMKIIIDCVFNHCDVTNKIFADVVRKGRDSKYYDWFLIDGDRPDPEKGNYAYFANCTYMPKWNTSNAQVRRYLIDIALGYVKAGFDGLRLDVADEISHEMWRQLRREVKEKYPETLMIGEVWHDNEHWLKGDQFDGVMNYKLQKILIDGFGKKLISAKTMAEKMNGLLVANTEQANAMSLNFLDNHDTPRFLRFAGGNRDALLCALCAMVMFTGMPCIFYGTELPLDGDGDPDCRKTFDWTFASQDKTYAQSFKAILGLKRSKALTGGYAKICEKDGVLTVVRERDGERVAAYFNTGDTAKPQRADGEVLFELNFKGNKILSNGVVVVKNKI